MRLISPLLHRVLYPVLANGGFFQRWRNRRNDYLAIVTYHGVLPANYKVEDHWLDGNLVRPEAFRQQLQFLKSHYTVISPETLFYCLENETELPPNAVLLTCDDGLLNHVTEMLPILRNENLSCLFFVTGDSLRSGPAMLWYEELYLLVKLARSGSIEIPSEAPHVYSVPSGIGQLRVFWWELVRKLSPFEAEARWAFMNDFRERAGLPGDWNSAYINDPTLRKRFLMLSQDGLQELVSAGMTIGSHTCAHPIMALLPDSLAVREMEKSKKSLETALGCRVWALAYPFGDPTSVTSREIFLAERAGYKCAFVNFGGLIASSLEHPFCLHRIHVSAEMTIADFEANTAGFHWAMREKIRPTMVTSGAA